MSYIWFQTSQTGGQQYSDTSPFSIPWGKYHWTIDLLFDWFWLVCFENKNKNCHTVDSKKVNQEVNCTVIPPPLVFPGLTNRLLGQFCKNLGPNIFPSTSFSSANAKKWEVELSTLKNNNARLTSALQVATTLNSFPSSPTLSQNKLARSFLARSFRLLLVSLRPTSSGVPFPIPHSKGRFLALHANIGLAWKKLVGENTLAYFGSVTNKNVL